MQRYSSYENYKDLQKCVPLSEVNEEIRYNACIFIYENLFSFKNVRRKL